MHHVCFVRCHADSPTNVSAHLLCPAPSAEHLTIQTQSLKEFSGVWACFAVCGCARVCPSQLWALGAWCSLGVKAIAQVGPMTHRGCEEPPQGSPDPPSGCEDTPPWRSPDPLSGCEDTSLGSPDPPSGCEDTLLGVPLIHHLDARNPLGVP